MARKENSANIIDGKPLETYRQGLAENAVGEFARVNGARDSANLMKVIGTIGGFAAWITYAIATSIPITAPLAMSVRAIHGIAKAAKAAGGIFAALAAIGVVKGFKNNMEIKGIANKYGLRAKAA